MDKELNQALRTPERLVPWETDWHLKSKVILVRHNTMFWQTISPHFVNNLKKRSEITIADEEENTLSKDEKMIPEADIKASIEKYKRHLSILKLRS